MEELVILDHSDSSVHFYKVDKDADLDYDFIEKLSCDFKHDIFLSDLEKSATMYAVDMCLEYRRKSGTTLAPVVIADISSQVCDVYMEFFKGQFRQANKNNCMQSISEMLSHSNVRDIVDNYYQKVNERYSWG